MWGKRKERTRKERTEEERTNKTKGQGNEINEIQNWIQNQMCFTSEFQRNNNGRENKEKETKEYTLQNIHIQVKHINGTQS